MLKNLKGMHALFLFFLPVAQFYTTLGIRLNTDGPQARPAPNI